MAARMFPTPTSRDHKDGDAHSCQNVPVNGLLVQEVHMLPTPTVDDAHNVTRASGAFQSLTREVREWPTPDSSPRGSRALDLVAENGKSVSRRASGQRRGIDLETSVQSSQAGGSLSPDWVSWLMGLPVGWTSLEPLPREDYDQWLQAQFEGAWWLEEQGLPRVATGVKNRVNRLKCLGNGIVPLVVANFLEEGYPCGQPMKRNPEQSYPTIRTY